MSIHDKIAVGWVIVSVLLILSILYRSMTAQKGAKARLQSIREESKIQFQEAIDISKQQLDVMKEILAELKALSEYAK